MYGALDSLLVIPDEFGLEDLEFEVELGRMHKLENWPYSSF